MTLFNLENSQILFSALSSICKEDKTNLQKIDI